MEEILIELIREQSAEEELSCPKWDDEKGLEEFSNWWVSWLVPLTKCYSDYIILKKNVTWREYV